MSRRGPSLNRIYPVPPARSVIQATNSADERKFPAGYPKPDIDEGQQLAVR